MNKQRRKEIKNISEELLALQDRIEFLKGQEEEAQYNMPENMQFNSEQWNKAEEAVDSLEYARDGIDDVLGYLESAAGEE